MKPTRWPLRVLASVLCATLSLPGPALALRVQTPLESAGAEELSGALTPVFEGPFREALRTVQLTTNSWMTQLTKGSISIWVDFETPVNPKHRPVWSHLVKGAGEDWWVHLHIYSKTPEGKTAQIVDGLLFHLVRSADGRILDVDHPMADTFALVELDPLAKDGTVPGEFVQRLVRLARQSVVENAQNRELLEHRIKSGLPSLFVLLSAVAPEDARGLFQMVKRQSLESNRLKEFPWREIPISYERLDLPPAAGAEETQEKPNATEPAPLEKLLAKKVVSKVRFFDGRKGSFVQAPPQGFSISHYDLSGKRELGGIRVFLDGKKGGGWFLRVFKTPLGDAEQIFVALHRETAPDQVERLGMLNEKSGGKPISYGGITLQSDLAGRRMLVYSTNGKPVYVADSLKLKNSPPAGAEEWDPPQEWRPERDAGGLDWQSLEDAASTLIIRGPFPAGDLPEILLESVEGLAERRRLQPDRITFRLEAPKDNVPITVERRLEKPAQLKKLAGVLGFLDVQAAEAEEWFIVVRPEQMRIGPEEFSIPMEFHPYRSKAVSGPFLDKIAFAVRMILDQGLRDDGRIPLFGLNLQKGDEPALAGPQFPEGPPSTVVPFEESHPEVLAPILRRLIRKLGIPEEPAGWSFEVSLRHKDIPPMATVPVVTVQLHPPAAGGEESLTERMKEARREEKRHHWEGALALWEQVLERKPGNPRVLLTTAVLLIHLGRNQPAAERLERVLRAKPEDFRLVEDAVQALLRIPLQEQKALEALSRTLQTSNGYPKIRARLHGLQETALQRVLERMEMDLNKPVDHRSELSVYVTDHALRGPHSDRPHHVGALVSLLPHGKPIGFIPMHYFRREDTQNRIGVWIRLLEQLEQTDTPIRVKILEDKRGDPAHPNFIFGLAHPVAVELLGQNLPIPTLIDPRNLPGLDTSRITVEEHLGDFWQATAEQMWNNATALLKHLELPSSSYVLNVGSSLRPLRLPPPWRQAVNLDPAKNAQQTSWKIGAAHLPYTTTEAITQKILDSARPDSLPDAVFLQNMEEFSGQEFWREVWSIVRPGGWLLLTQRPVAVQTGPVLQRAYLQFREATREGAPAPAEVQMIGPDPTMGSAFAIAIRKPAAGGEEANVPGSVKIVLGPSAMAQVPGLAAAVEALRRAGLEERLIVLPEESLPEAEQIDQLATLATKILAAGAEETLFSYAASSDPVAEKFRGMVAFPGITYLRRDPAGLAQLLPEILRDLGLPAAQSEVVTEEILWAAGLEEAA